MADDERDNDPSDLPPPLPNEEIAEMVEADEVPNAVPDPYHDTRAVHGDTGHPNEQEDNNDG